MEQDKVVIQLHKPDTDEMLFFLLCGAITSVPLTLFIAQPASSLLVGFDALSAALISTTIFSPLIEEFSKAFPLFYRHGETERSIVNLALFVGVGFGLVELLTYVFVLDASIIDRLPGLFFHPASTSITAYGIATKRPLPFYAIAVAFHLLNNFLVLTTPFPASGSIAIVAITVFTSWQLHSKTKEKIVV
jgi:RsiW-degrading membrane proteinase PrsW (M82 family)